MPSLICSTTRPELLDISAAPVSARGPSRFRISHAAWRRLAVFGALWCATVLLLYLSGTFDRELGGDPDEAAHFMTGLMIHDYVASGIKTPPSDFATDFYLHYPKIAFGIWPPLFHVIEAAWMLLISPSKVSVFFLLSGITALLAYLLFRTVDAHFGFAAGCAAALLLISVPLVQAGTSRVLIDNTVALFSFLAILRFGRYLDHRRWQDAAMFGIWASAAILSKYNGLALAFVPPLCAALSGRWKLMLRRPVWLAAGIVFLVCGSWYFPMSRLVMYAAEPLPGIETILPALRMNTATLAGMMGIPVAIVAGLGLVLTVWRPRGRAQVEGLWIASAALVIGFWAFHSVASPDPERRYLLPALPPMILFVAAGIDGLSRRLRVPSIVMAAGVGVVYITGTFTLLHMPHMGYAEAAGAIANQLDPSQRIVLADGSPESEGMTVSEIALQDSRPAHYVLRASKLLATSTWMGEHYRPLYATIEGVLQALDQAGVSAVVLQADAPADVLHHRLLAQALRSAPGTWQLWSEAPWKQSGGLLRVYRRARPLHGFFCSKISLIWTLGTIQRFCVAPGPPN